MTTFSDHFLGSRDYVTQKQDVVTLDKEMNVVDQLGINVANDVICKGQAEFKFIDDNLLEVCQAHKKDETYSYGMTITLLQLV